jgi:hypothetical protein
MVLWQPESSERSQKDHLRTGIALSVEASDFLGHGGSGHGSGLSFREGANEAGALGLENG